MLNEGDYVIKTGLVESIEDEFDGGRIKVRLRSDGNNHTGFTSQLATDIDNIALLQIEAVVIVCKCVRAIFFCSHIKIRSESR